MFSQKILVPTLNECGVLIKKSAGFKHLDKSLNKMQFRFSTNKTEDRKRNINVITYAPIRPLKKSITSLFIQNEYLNKGKVVSKVHYWPYLTPFFAMICNNFLTSWTIVNSSLASVFLVSGILIRQSLNQQRQKTIIKLECNNDMSRFYITVPNSLTSEFIAKMYTRSYKQIQEANLQEAVGNKKQFNTTSQVDKQNLSKQQLKIMQEYQFNRKALHKLIAKQNNRKQTKRFQLNSQKTSFKLSNQSNDMIRENQFNQYDFQLKPSELNNVPFKYVIIKTEFINPIRNKPYHFFIDLEENGDLKYHDYLVAIGANYKISL